MTVCLVLVQNHQFMNNIDRLEELYRDRFEQIVHLVPFYDGFKGNVIPVYESSYYFSGYFAQAARDLARLQVDHFIFAADDLIINPRINSKNYRREFALDHPGACFFPNFKQFPDLRTQWYRADDAANWSAVSPGVEVHGLLPAPDEARRKFREHGIRGDSVNSLGMFRPTLDPQGEARDVQLAFPLVGGISDLVIISREVLREFATLCGIFAVTRLFVEVAVPTALVLSATHISTQANIALGGRHLWGDEVLQLDAYKRDLLTLLDKFPDGWLYVHPVKLSQWT